jgi:hypothetical protein
MLSLCHIEQHATFISLGFYGVFVELKEIDGEYYPVRKYDNWIS